MNETQQKLSSTTDISSILYTNLNLLKFQPISQWKQGPYIDTRLDKFMFLKGSTYNQATEICFYFLFNKINKELTIQRLKPHYPCFNSNDSRKFKDNCFKWLQELKQSNNLISLIPIRASYLKECRGPNFEKIILSLSITALNEVSQREFNQSLNGFNLLSKQSDIDQINHQIIIKSDQFLREFNRFNEFKLDLQKTVDELKSKFIAIKSQKNQIESDINRLHESNEELKNINEVDLIENIQLFWQEVGDWKELIEYRQDFVKGIIDPNSYYNNLNLSKDLSKIDLNEKLIELTHEMKNSQAILNSNDHSILSTSPENQINKLNSMQFKLESNLDQLQSLKAKIQSEIQSKMNNIERLKMKNFQNNQEFKNLIFPLDRNIHERKFLNSLESKINQLQSYSYINNNTVNISHNPARDFIEDIIPKISKSDYLKKSSKNIKQLPKVKIEEDSKFTFPFSKPIKQESNGPSLLELKRRLESIKSKSTLSQSSSFLESDESHMNLSPIKDIRKDNETINQLMRKLQQRKSPSKTQLLIPSTSSISIKRESTDSFNFDEDFDPFAKRDKINN